MLVASSSGGQLWIIRSCTMSIRQTKLIDDSSLFRYTTSFEPTRIARQHYINSVLHMSVILINQHAF